MPRTTAAAVRGIIDVDPAFTDSGLDPFIIAANELVTEVCATVLTAAGADFYTSTRLELIERWLAAHFYAIDDLRRSQESAKGVSESFQYKLGLVLQSTMHGQQAMLLDTAGGLARLSKQLEEGTRKKVGRALWLGTPEEEVVP